MTSRTFYRAMRADDQGQPLCGMSGARLGVRPRDITERGGIVEPGSGGMSVTPDDPSRLPDEFRPESLGGIGRLPVFSIESEHVRGELSVRDDPRRPASHAFVEPSFPMRLAQYQASLCATAPIWSRFER